MKGGGSTYLPVFADSNDLLMNDPGTSKIKCDSQHDCAIVGVTTQRRMFAARISFAPSPSACPAQGSTTPLGTGSSAATRAMYRWSASTCLPPQSLSIGYATNNEHDAYTDFFAGTSDFGVTGLRPSPWVSSSAQTYKLAPLSVSGAVLAYRAYDNRGPQITTLTLSPEIIAALFMGQIANFSGTPAITALNPGISFPPRTHIVARAEYNSESYIFNAWLSAVAPNTWKPPLAPAPDIFPATGIDLKFGERATALAIVDPPTGFDKQVVYIGLIDSSTAAFYGLPTVKIAMPNGSSITATSDSILKAVADSSVGPDGTLIPKWNSTANPIAYPMPMVTYMIAPTNKTDPAKGDALAKFLRYAVQDGQTLLSDVDGYARLPANLVQASLAVADLIPVPLVAPPPADTPPVTTVPPLPELPPLPESAPPAPVAAPPPAATKPEASSAGPPTVVAALTYSQGVQLVSIVHDEVGAPGEFAVPSAVGIVLLLIWLGLALQLGAIPVNRRQG